MNAQDFLEAHWPRQGHYCLATPFSYTDDDTGEKKSGYKHYIYDDIDRAMAQYELLRDDHDVYFAVNTLRENRRKQARVHDNMAYSRCLFLDLDVGTKEGKTPKYKTQQDAVAALVEFCETVNLPLPTLVSSGYGVHCYWRFEKDLSVNAWLKYANLLYRLVLHHNFKADPNCVKDQSRVLRVPGSLNFKDKTNPKNVKVKHLSDPVNSEDIWYTLVDACEAAGLSTDTTQTTVGKSVGRVAGGGNLSGPAEFNGRVPDYAQVLASCAQVQFIEENGGALERPHWHKGLLGLIRRCSDGREHCHRLSKKNYSNYSYDEVETKLNEQDMAGVGPTTCAVMAEVANNGKCEGCPAKGHTISPINAPFLVRALSAADLPAPQKTVTANETYTYDPPPLPGGGYQWVTKNDAKTEAAKSQRVGVGLMIDKEGRDHLIQFLDYVLFPLSRQQNHSGDGDQHIWCVYVPNEEPKTFVLPSATIYDQRELSKVLSGQGIYVDASFFKMVQTYMSAYVKRLQRDCKPEQKYMHYGWVDGNTGFIIGDHKIMKGGKTVPVQCSGGAADLLDTFNLRRAGDLQLQIDALKHFTRHNKPNEQFYILCSLASPLIHMLDNYYGVTINATGETGGGKTGLLFAAMSLWGNPRTCYMSGVAKEGASPKARINGLFSMWSLPFALDEISGIEPDDARSLTYAATQPRSRTVASKEGGFQKRTGSTLASNDDEDFRANLLLTTSNGSLHSRLSEGSVVGAATSARVIEIDYPVLTPEAKIAGDEMLPIILRNYGHIGELFIRYVIENYAEVKSQVCEKAKEIDRVFGVKLAERFLSCVAPCVFVASVIARKLGLLDFDENAIMQWLMVEQLQRIRGVIEMEYTTPAIAINDLVDEYINQMVFVDKFNGRVSEPVMPKYQAVRGRYEKHLNIMYISSDTLHSYFARKKLPRKEFMNTLTEMKIILGAARVQLARGTDFAAGRSQCYVINMNHDEMKETTEQIEIETQSRLKVVSTNEKPDPTDKPGLDPAALKLLKGEDDAT